MLTRWTKIPEVITLTEKSQRKDKDYSAFIGEKFGMLTILEILPRERDSYGDLIPPSCICLCDCGSKTKHRLYNVVNQNILSCGCMKGKHGVDRNGNTPASIVDALSAIYYCNYPTGTCVRSNTHRLCCHECDRKGGCPQACQNTPDKCGAQIRDDMSAAGKNKKGGK